jgi:hypothetical protein
MKLAHYASAGRRACCCCLRRHCAGGTRSSPTHSHLIAIEQLLHRASGWCCSDVDRRSRPTRTPWFGGRARDRRPWRKGKDLASGRMPKS